MSPVHSRHPRRIPTSRAYWELKAEQVMNRVFAVEPSIELEVIEPTPAQPPTSRNLDKPRLTLTAGLGALIGLTAASAAGWSLWLQQQQALQQERNLLLIERIRTLRPAEGAAAGTNKTPGVELPPPPPLEPWMQELAELPTNPKTASQVLRVPVNGRISRAAPAAAVPEPAAAPSTGLSNETALPELLGVIEIPGRRGSAIFEVGGHSTTAAVGERIGDSDWKLLSAKGDSAVIERRGNRRRISISNGS